MVQFIVSMINLYIFNEVSRAAVYGVGTYIKELVTALKNSNINICVVHLRSEKPDEESEKSENIRHWYIPSPIGRNVSLDWEQQSELYFRNVVYLLQMDIKDTNNLIFHLNFNQSGKLIEKLRESFACKITTTIHYLNWCFSLSGNILRFRELIANLNDSEEYIKKDFLKEKEFFKLPDKVICLSEVTQNIIQNDYKIKKSNISLIYNGLRDEKINISKKELRKKYNIPLNVPVFLHVGRLDENKGLNYVISAFKQVLTIFPRSHLFIAGSGSYDIYLKKCEDIWLNITFTGRLEKFKLYEFYSLADIGLMPSFTEQCSYVAIEMMMHGLPLIASTSTGLKEMIEDGVCGLHIPVTEYLDRAEIDSSLLAEKMLYLLQHPEERKQMGKNARKRYKKLFSSEIMGRKMTELYHSLFE